MSVSTNAILFYGFMLGDEDGWDGPFDPEEWEEVYCIKNGLTEPDEEYEDHETEFQEFWRKVSKLRERAGCEIDSHCSNDFPQYYVCVTKSRTTANRGYPAEIKSLDVDPNWKIVLKEFCTVMDIEYQEPRWWLVSYWG